MIIISISATVHIFIEPEIPDITQEEEGGEGEGGEQKDGETAPPADEEPKEQALGVSTPTGDGDDNKKGTFFFLSSI